MTQRHPHSIAPGRSPSKTVAVPHIPLPAANRATASQADPPPLIFSVSASASQHLIIKMLRRPVEFNQYASADYRRLLDAHGIVCSMSRRANCWHNAVVESFFATLKTELIHHADYQSPAEARAAISSSLRCSTIGNVATRPSATRHQQALSGWHGQLNQPVHQSRATPIRGQRLLDTLATADQLDVRRTMSTRFGILFTLYASPVPTLASRVRLPVAWP